MDQPELILRAAHLFSPPYRLEGEAVLVRGGRIAALGKLKELRQRAPGAELIDLGRATLLPGFIDSHTHFFEWARRLEGLDLSGARTYEELRAALARHRDRLAAQGNRVEEGEWIGGSGWDPAFLRKEPRLDRELLDEFFPDRPVSLEARDFHTLFCNSAALERAGVLSGARAPAGGEIGRRKDGSPNGLLIETAWQLIVDARPPEPEATRAAWLKRAIRQAHRLGLTSFHSMEQEEARRSYRLLADRGELGMRVVFHSPVSRLEERLERHAPSYLADDDWLRWGGVKVFVDGSLGSCSAYMLDPYPNGGHGCLITPRDELVAQIVRAASGGIAPTIHAIGDAAVRLTADALEEAESIVRASGKTIPSGARMEHAQCVRPEEVPRLARLGVLCAMQSIHIADDVPLLPELWPEACKFAYPMRSLLDAGVPIALGSDVPVASPDPRQGIYAALERRAGNVPTGDAWTPEQALTTEEALAGYTRWAARAGGWQDELGALEAGYRADLVAMEIPEEGAPNEVWLGARLRMTMVDGRIVFEDLP